MALAQRTTAETDHRDASSALILKRALDDAAVWHKGQVRKYPGVAVPYVSHIAGVVAILARHGFDVEVQAAGALHDVIEDCGVLPTEIEERYGKRVAELVKHCSEDDRSLPWEERKRAYVEKFPNKPWEAQAITLSDKLDNFASIIVCHELHGNPWSMFKRGKAAQIERFEALGRAANTLAPHPLIDEYQAGLERLKAVPE
ncbi:MAG: HD domain-containing protein [Polyangiaceae bacterium]|nr:HD domain-containing protein [Polyangiaceae bacterium]